MVSLRGIAGCLALFALAITCDCGGSTPAPAAPEVNAVAAIPLRALRPHGTSPKLTCTGDEFTVDYLDAVDAIPDGPLEEQREQLRDWIWTAVLARIGARSNDVADVFAREVLDGPSQRVDSMPGILQGSFGPTRATTDSHDRAIVLVDHAFATDASADALEAIDEAASHRGGQPEGATVYGYTLDPKMARARVCITHEYDAAALKAASTGYRTAKVNTPSDLKTFLAGGVDLLGAQCTADGLELSGRMRARAAAAPIQVDDVAAIAQSYGPTTDPNHGAGFSLDPRRDLFDVGQATADLNAASGAVTAGRLPELLATWKTSQTVQQLVREAPAEDRLSAFELTLLGSIVARSDPAAASDVLANARGYTRHLVAEAVGLRDGRQCARYEGALQGTSAGMTLFYTDLMAKEWGLDERVDGVQLGVPGFHAPPTQPIATDACASSIKSEDGRLWFGLRTEGILLTPDGLSFAPRSTRLFGKAMRELASSASGEVDFGAQDVRSFLLWWDHHFGAVAKWEPQYERLNQIIKWSAVFAQSKDGACGDFLAAYPVDRSQRFDRWVQSTPGLQRHRPAELVSTDTGRECLPILSSDYYAYCGLPFTVSGGVSAASETQILARRATTALPPAARRIESVGTKLRPTTHGLAFDAVDRADAWLKNGQVEATSSTATADVTVAPKRLTRGSMETWWLPGPAESGQTHLKRTISLKGTEVRAEQTLGGFGIGHLRYSDLQGTEIHVQAGPDSVYYARRSADRVLDQERRGLSFDQAVHAAFPGGEAVVVDPTHARVALRVADGTTEVAVLESGAGNRGPPAPGFTRGIPVSRIGTAGFDLPKDFVLNVSLQRTAVKKGSTLAGEADSPIRTAAQGSDWQKLETLLAEQAASGAVPGPDITADIRHARVLADRAGVKAPTLEKLEMLADFADLSRRQGDMSPEELQRVAERAAIFTTTGTVSVADIPPVSYAPGVSPQGGHGFTSRVFESAFATPPPAIAYGNETLRLAQDAPHAAANDPSSLGSAYRLAGHRGMPIIVVIPCDDNDPGKADCHCSDWDPHLRPCSDGMPAPVQSDSSTAPHARTSVPPAAQPGQLSEFP